MGFTEIGLKTVKWVEMSKDVIVGSYKFVSEHYNSCKTAKFLHNPRHFYFLKTNYLRWNWEVYILTLKCRLILVMISKGSRTECVLSARWSQLITELKIYLDSV